ncbi:Mpo1 family 2-hydroxy fatty acid dioxygenase [Aquimarina pacifica]|uniref:Mpo1 family 2-hydroxy fatty acid dioxygenase n=1 Tax=Aquimarina pacifica TaxID=1296415 RepID=UPI0004717DE8|nr:Mpo1-like protein [Aquimarina pacifica]
MKSLETWFSEYAVSHQNKTNIAIHFVCVPAIVFSVVGLLMSIPSGFLASIIPGTNPFIENWAFIVLLLVVFFYIRLSIKMALQIIVFSALCIVGNYYLGQFVSLWIASIAIFVIAWLGQFYGHKLEGKKPSFIKDLQYLLIGPAWVIQKMFGKKS